MTEDTYTDWKGNVRSGTRCECGHHIDAHEDGRCQSGDDDGDGYFDQCWCDERFVGRILEPAPPPPGTGPGAEGTLAFTVWPSYVGFCTADPGPGPVPYGEPTVPVYRRGQIQWGMENGEIVGRAFVNVPKTSPLLPYTHQGFFSGPEGDCMIGKAQLSQPLPFPSDGVIEVYPITNPDLRMNMAQGIDYQ